MSVKEMTCRNKADFLLLKGVICACTDRLFVWLKTCDINCQFHSVLALGKKKCKWLISSTVFMYCFVNLSKWLM